MSRNPNIHGAKCSGDLGKTRGWIDRFGDYFRIIVANVPLLDVLIRHGVHELLDGMWSGAPGRTQSVAECAAAGRWQDSGAAHATDHGNPDARRFHTNSMIRATFATAKNGARGGTRTPTPCGTRS